MKIMIINGSPRKNGATAYILHRIEEVLSSMGVEVIFYNLIEQKMALCNGCCVCYKTGYCVYDDDAENISKQIYNIDGLVIGSSTIASNVPGVLKSFIDRGHFVVEQLLYDKYTLCVATYENYGGYSAFRVLKNLVTLSGSFLTGKIVVKLPFNSDYSSIPKLNKVSEKYALRACLKSSGMPDRRGFFRWARRFDAGILCVFQVKSTRPSGKRCAGMAF